MVVRNLDSKFDSLSGQSRTDQGTDSVFLHLHLLSHRAERHVEPIPVPSTYPHTRSSVGRTEEAHYVVLVLDC